MLPPGAPARPHAGTPCNYGHCLPGTPPSASPPHSPRLIAGFALHRFHTVALRPGPSARGAGRFSSCREKKETSGCFSKAFPVAREKGASVGGPPALQDPASC